jgi:hypothetical protein
MKTLKWLLVLAIVLGLAGSVAFGADAVRVWEEPLVIPTYLTGEPEILPMFYQGRAYQGAQGHIYPYHLLDELTDVKQDKTYRAVYLENEYVKVCVLPELGGRIFSVVDKTDNYDIFYHQHVIKPALIGMLGAWISGGVEWCAIHHHRTTSFMPVDYTLIENPDGSRTIWVGETELRQRMKWMVGVCAKHGPNIQRHALCAIVPVLGQRRHFRQQGRPGHLSAQRGHGHVPFQEPVLPLADLAREVQRRGLHRRRGRQLDQESHALEQLLRLELPGGFPGRVRPR